MKKEIRVRCWIDLDGEKFFGPGQAELLELIQESGSIAQAARQMGMSYKKAWVMVDEMNTRGRKPFVVTQKGGQQGGDAEVTETRRKVKDLRQISIPIRSHTSHSHCFTPARAVYN
jgi:molybdate transport system regulatory protein